MSSSSLDPSVLAEKDVNTDITTTNASEAAGGEPGPKDLEYHRQVLANKMAAGKGGDADNYVSPSDNIMSPCTAKLTAYKNKQFGKAKPQSLFAKTSSKNMAAQGTLFAAGTGKVPVPTAQGAMFADKPASSSCPEDAA